MKPLVKQALLIQLGILSTALFLWGYSWAIIWELFIWKKHWILSLNDSTINWVFMIIGINLASLFFVLALNPEKAILSPRLRAFLMREIGSKKRKEEEKEEAIPTW